MGMGRSGWWGSVYDVRMRWGGTYFWLVGQGSELWTFELAYEACAGEVLMGRCCWFIPNPLSGHSSLLVG